MITETLCFRLSSKSCIFLPCMQMSKNRPRVNLPGTGSFKLLESLPHFKTRNRSFLLLFLQFRCLGLPGVVGLTGLEPVTLRLSSACSNQLSYRPLGHSFGFRLASGFRLWPGLPGRSPPRGGTTGPASPFGYAGAGFALHFVAHEAWRQGDSNP